MYSREVHKRIWGSHKKKEDMRWRKIYEWSHIYIASQILCRENDPFKTCIKLNFISFLLMIWIYFIDKVLKFGQLCSKISAGDQTAGSRYGECWHAKDNNKTFTLDRGVRTEKYKQDTIKNNRTNWFVTLCGDCQQSGMTMIPTYTMMEQI